tara:strand:+ start:566 stop:802 length:237 start_codon:yes stop_codon:yes gene_type:complete
MKTLVKAQTKLTRVSFNHLNSYPKVQLNNTKPTLSIKFYQNVFLVFFVLSIFLIFPESPKDSENLCKKYNSTEICNIW